MVRLAAAAVANYAGLVPHPSGPRGGGGGAPFVQGTFRLWFFYGWVPLRGMSWPTFVVSNRITPGTVCFQPDEDLPPARILVGSASDFDLRLAPQFGVGGGGGVGGGVVTVVMQCTSLGINAGIFGALRRS